MLWGSIFWKARSSVVWTHHVRVIETRDKRKRSIMTPLLDQVRSLQI